MNAAVQILCDAQGNGAAAQLPYAEYVKLKDSAHDALILRNRLKQIKELLGSHRSTEGITVPAGRPPLAPSPATEILRPPVLEEPPVSREPLPEKPAVPAVPEASPAIPALEAEDPKLKIPPILLNFMKEQDPSGTALNLVENCVQKLSRLCGKRITLSLHKPYICLWDFDDWKSFAFGEVINGKLYLSIEKSLALESSSAEIWTPPSGLCKQPLVRLEVPSVTDSLLGQLKRALACSG